MRNNNPVAAVLISLSLVIAAIFLSVILGRSLERRTYLLNFKEEIGEYSAEFELDPYMIAAIIHCESGNRPEVTSHAGAVGLMQIMPDTGEWICGKLDISYNKDMLETPALNIRLGCWYLRFLLDRYDANIDNALAAYNAGHGNVDKWLEDPKISGGGELKNIPFKETAEYSIKVHRAYDKYKTLYSNAF